MSQVLWTWSDLCTALDLSKVDGPDVHGVTTDSRSVEKGDLFVALSGAPRPEFNVFEDSGRDGHSFIADAVRNEACGVLVHEETDDVIPHLLVGDTLDAMWKAAKHRRRELACPVIAVTGSSGKTTFKDLLNQIVKGYCSSGSFNNHIGVPISLMRTPKDASSAIYEIGTNHPGEIGKLTKLVNPTVAVCLNVQEAHIGNFKNKVALRKEKLSIFSGLVPDGIAIAPYELREFVSSEITAEQRLLTFGTEAAADVSYSLLSPYETRISTDEKSIDVEIPGGGAHRAATLCSIATLLQGLNVSWDRLMHIQDQLPEGRGNSIEIGSTTLIDESYNANPSSMKAALKHFGETGFQKKLAILGDMNELGEESALFHTELAGYVDEMDALIVVGEKILPIAENLPAEKVLEHFDQVSDECLDFCASKIPEFDGVLVKGSNTIFWTRNFCERLVTRSSDQSDS